MASPYSATRVNTSLFYGRGRLAETLIDGIDRGMSYAVVGGRRMGKSTLVRRVVELLRERREAASSSAIMLPAVVDAHALEVPEAGAIWAAWLGALEGEVGRNPAKPLHDVTYGHFVSALEGLLREPGMYTLVVLVLDDYDRFLSFDWEEVLRSNLTALIGNTPGISERISLIITGDHYLHGTRTGPSSNLGTLLKWKRLSSLSMSDTKRLMEKPCRLSWPDELVLSVWRDTAGHPALIQEWMHQAMHSSRWPAPAAIETVRGSVASEVELVFDRWWARFDGVTRDVFGLLRRSEPPIHIEMISGLFGHVIAHRGMEIFESSGVVTLGDEDASTITHLGGLFLEWYDRFGAVRPESEEITDRTDKVIVKLELGLREWIIDRLQTNQGDALAYIRQKFSIPSAEWAKRAAAARVSMDSLSIALRYSDLPDLFAIILSEWAVLGGVFDWRGPSGKDKTARQRNIALFEERRDKVVSTRHAIRHARREDLSLEDCIVAYHYCSDLLSRIAAR